NTIGNCRSHVSAHKGHDITTTHPGRTPNPAQAPPIINPETGDPPTPRPTREAAATPPILPAPSPTSPKNSICNRSPPTKRWKASTKKVAIAAAAKDPIAFIPLGAL